jgi:protein gp37
MNEQKPPKGIEWTRIKKADGTFRRGFTWNPVSGCLHGCQWEIGGAIAQCYAKTVAEKFTTAYPKGFEHHYWHPERLREPLAMKEPAGIFLDSMSDLMGTWVSDDEIEQVLEACRQADWHIFQLLTKNAPRLKRFTFPPNVWVGVSSPPDWMFGKRLTLIQQYAMLERTLKTLQEVNATVRWMSFEPLSWDVSGTVSQYEGALNWAVIGAASNGAKEYPPKFDDLMNLMKVLDRQNTPIFFKGNMRALIRTAAMWRAEFPTIAPAPVLTQMELFNDES